MPTLNEVVPLLENNLFGRSDLARLVANSDLPLPIKMVANVGLTSITDEKIGEIQNNVAMYLRALLEGETDKIIEAINHLLGDKGKNA